MKMAFSTRNKLAAVVAVAAMAGGLAALTGGGSAAGAAPATSTVICDNGTVAPDGAIEYNLEARDGYIQEPDGNTVYAWSYSPAGAPLFQFPGPNMCIDEGATVRVTLTNPDHIDNLSGGIPAATTSILFPGQVGVTATGGVSGLLTQEVDTAVPGDSVTYEFVASSPGTYIYQSGTDQAVQVQMGMFGGLIIYPTAGRGFAYDGEPFDTTHEYLLLFHEMDPDLHTEIELASRNGLVGDAVLDGYQPLNRISRYWTINGRSFPDIIAPNNAPTLPTQPYGGLVRVNADDPNDGFEQLPSLVRYGNAGLENHPFHPHGNTLRLIAQDGRPFPDEIEAYTKTVAAGQTFDLLASWEDVEAWQGSGAPTPINVPALDNLVFKGGATFYSGDPNLGQNQDLPASVTSYSVCGEYYFPWHSHALQEIVNYNEGFGGMLTLWRVDPPMEEVSPGVWQPPAACN